MGFPLTSTTVQDWDGAAEALHHIAAFLQPLCNLHGACQGLSYPIEAPHAPYLEHHLLNSLQEQLPTGNAVIAVVK